MQMAADKSELQKESSMLRSKLVAEKQHAAVLQVICLAMHSLLGTSRNIALRTDPYKLLSTQVEPIFPDSIFSLSRVVAWYLH